MSFNFGQRMDSSNILFYFDADNPKCYISGRTCNELIYNDTPISMWNEDFLSQIIDPCSNNYKKIVEYVANQCIDFITTNLSWVEDENSKLNF